MHLILGDVHGDTGFLRTAFNYCRANGISNILQVGDLGYWPRMSVVNDRMTKVLSDNSDIKLQCVDGNHEDFISLAENPGAWGHIARGSLLTIGNYNVLFIGGAHSIDLNYRLEGYNWFPEENITDEDLERALSHDSVDMVISHDCPEFIQPVSHVNPKDFDLKSRGNREKLAQIWDKYIPDLWFFGHWHQKFQKVQYTDYPAGTMFYGLPANVNKYMAITVNFEDSTVPKWVELE